MAVPAAAVALETLPEAASLAPEAETAVEEGVEGVEKIPSVAKRVLPAIKNTGKKIIREITPSEVIEHTSTAFSKVSDRKKEEEKNVKPVAVGGRRKYHSSKTRERERDKKGRFVKKGGKDSESESEDSKSESENSESESEDSDTTATNEIMFGGGYSFLSKRLHWAILIVLVLILIATAAFISVEKLGGPAGFFIGSIIGAISVATIYWSFGNTVD